MPTVVTSYNCKLFEIKYIIACYNKLQGGPGGILLTIDGESVPLDKWKCAKLSTRGQNPEEAYPGVLSLDFDDSDWSNAVVSLAAIMCLYRS